ncbi:glycoside hydrolase superfamily [Crassisporium funariophilum]|nr:glycoside hydrolase superfamily [Crassisporium funariophilum]
MRFTAALLSCALLTLVGAQNRGSSVPKGFVTTKGDQFQLNGKPFAFVGANSYWLPLLTSKDDVHTTFKEMQGAGIKVLRTWGFNAINGTELAGAIKSDLTYYQVWNSSEWVLNDGPQGLQRLDYVIETAGKYGIKVIIAFTNNWYGSELYVNWIAGAGKTHDVFYSDPKIIASYQRYVTTIVNRYKKSSNIFAWELMNEARCLGDLPGGPNCAPGTELLSHWYKQQSDFVRALDPHHLITTGGEGHFYWKENPVGFWFNGTFVSDYNYNGQAGEDFDADLKLKNIDFGTYHIYPEFWFNTPGSNFSVKTWGLGWIQQHADAAKKAGKPLILEEFGTFGLQNKTEVYPEWVGLALKTRHGIMPWQFGQLGLKESGGNRLIKYADALIDGATPNDGFTFYKNQTAVWNVFR